MIREIAKSGARGFRAATGAELQELVASPDFDSLLIDSTRLLELGGISALDRTIWALKPLVILVQGGCLPQTLWPDQLRPIRVMPSQAPAEELAAALVTLTSRGSRVNALVETALGYRQRLATLKPGERPVLQGIISGRLNKQIASELDVSIRTIEQRRRRIYDRFNVTSPAELCFAAGVAECIDALLGEAS
ncbi:MAG: hypothetical protein KDA37_18410 [Planctomycetales bacterium]|nr:hypothetical protein [Planctomycetales bacterium]